MPVTIVCPNFRCKAMLQVNDAMRGQNIKCAKCGQVILVPKKAKGK